MSEAGAGGAGGNLAIVLNSHALANHRAVPTQQPSANHRAAPTQQPSADARLPLPLERDAELRPLALPFHAQHIGTTAAALAAAC